MADPKADLPNEPPAVSTGRFRPRSDPGRNAGPPAGRWAAVDVTRGAALVGMAVYHVDWDLAFLRWRDGDPAASAGWTIFGHLVAACFLFLSGFGLVLALPKGLGAAARRIAVIGGAAACVTLATFRLFPDDAIVFGILHCIAVTNALALPLLRAPLPVIVLLAVAGVAAPAVVALPAEAGPGWAWTGLTSAVPRSLDFRPVLPWFGVVLLGLASARVANPMPRRPARGKIAAGLAWAGRHSLVLYLGHQPVVLAILVPLGALVAPHAPERADFTAQCRAECAAAGARPRLCDTACRCAAAKLDRPMSGAPPPSDDRLRQAAAACLRSGMAPGTEQDQAH